MDKIASSRANARTVIATQWQERARVFPALQENYVIKVRVLAAQ